MHKIHPRFVLTPFIFLCFGSACDASTSPSKPNVALADVTNIQFVSKVTNPYFPLPVGATWVYEATTPDGLERAEVEVLADTKLIMGVTATIVHDTVKVDGVIAEETWDWYAQDTAGAVWYLGEDTCEFEAGQCAKHVGAWTWGEKGALPGILMPAKPVVDGQPYYQEFYKGQAEDVGEVVAVGLAAETKAGKWTNCIKTHDTSALDSKLDEYKTYCAGVGTVIVKEPNADVTLQSSTGL
jgi:hypothetical protein